MVLYFGGPTAIFFPCRRDASCAAPAARNLAIAKKPATKSVAEARGSTNRDQGALGSCTTHAFAGAAAKALLYKYDITMDEQNMRQQIFDLCGPECRRGIDADDLIGTYNATMSNKDAPGLENADKTKTIFFNTECSKRYVDLSDAVKAFDEHGACGGLLVVIKTPESGQKLHTVDVIGRLPGSVLYAANSWGPRKSVVPITKKNFVYGVLIDPKITRWINWPQVPRPLTGSHRRATECDSQY